MAAVKANASAAVKTVADLPASYDVLYEGTVVLTPEETFSATAYSTAGVPSTYIVSRTTPLGALDKAATAGGFAYKLADKNYAGYGTLLLDDIDTYTYGNPGKWLAYVNNVFKDGYMNTAGGLNVIELADGDKSSSIMPLVLWTKPTLLKCRARLLPL